MGKEDQGEAAKEEAPVSCLTRLAATIALGASLVPLAYVADTPEDPLYAAPATPSPTPVRSVRPTTAPAAERVSRKQGDRFITGRASWYATGKDGLYAAAGPALRKALGPGWRGDRVLVCARRKCEEVVLNDYCGCRGGTGKAIDLSDEAFRYFAPLSRGVITVTIGW